MQVTHTHMHTHEHTNALAHRHTHTHTLLTTSFSHLSVLQPWHQAQHKTWHVLQLHGARAICICLLELRECIVLQVGDAW